MDDEIVIPTRPAGEPRLKAASVKIDPALLGRRIEWLAPFILPPPQQAGAPSLLGAWVGQAEPPVRYVLIQRPAGRWCPCSVLSALVGLWWRLKDWWAT